MASLVRWVGRAIGLDVRDFCVVAICEDGQTRHVGRVPATPDGIRTLAESLLASDRVAVEVSGGCWEVARLLEPHVNRVVVVSPDDTGIANARYANSPVLVLSGREKRAEYGLLLIFTSSISQRGASTR